VLRNLAVAGAMLTALGWHGGSIASPQPIVKFEIVYYEAGGSTISQIHDSMFRNSPIRSDRGTFGGLTTNTIYANYDLMQTARGCEVRNPVVNLHSVVTLPKLSDDVRSAGTEREWERFIGALRAHELMHARNGHAIARTVLSRLYKFRSRQSCITIKTRLDTAIHTLIANMNEYDRHLDRDTSHGATQGAQLNLNVR
jgi:predicted secreted Zn-dependent protease